MSYFPKTRDAVEDVIESVLDERIVRAIEDWQNEDLDYTDHLDMGAFEAEKKRLAAFLAKRYEVTSGPDVMDSRVARALRSYASGIGVYFDEADLGSPAWTFTHMEQMQDLKYLVEDTREEAEAQGWATEEMPADFSAIKSYLEYQHKLMHQWMYHLSVCENCFGGHRSEPLFPPVETEKVMDEAGQGSRGDRQQGHHGGHGPGPQEGAGFDGTFVDDGLSEEEYRRLIEPNIDSVGESVRIQADEISPDSLHEADLEEVPEAVRSLLQQGYSPVHRLLDQMRADDVESFYIRLRLHPTSDAGAGDLACFVSSGYDIGPHGLSKVAEQVGERLADHIAENVKPKLQERSGLQTVIIEVETDERLMHVVLESGSSVA